MNEPTRYACSEPDCPRTFATLTLRRMHLRTMHDVDVPTLGEAEACEELHAVMAATEHSQTHKRLLQRRGERGL